MSEKVRDKGGRERERERFLTISGLTGSLEPISEVTHKIKEEITVWYTDHFVADLYKQRESFCSLQTQALSNGGAELF